MINYQEEIKRFQPSLDVDNIEDAIAGMGLTDMNDLMMQLVHDTALSRGQQMQTRTVINTSEDENEVYDT